MPRKRRQLPVLHTFEYCDKVEVENGKRTLSGLFESINVLGVPAVHPSFSVVLGFSRGKGSLNVRLVVRSPTNKKLVDKPFKIEFRSVDSTTYMVLDIAPFHIMELGKYRIVVYIGEKEIGERAFYVIMQEVPELSGKEIKELMLKPDVIKKVRAELFCPDCKAKYVFQLNLDPTQPVGEDALPFPPDNKFRCPNDDYEIDLTGIKLSLKKMLGRPPPKKREG